MRCREDVRNDLAVDSTREGKDQHCGGVGVGVGVDVGYVDCTAGGEGGGAGVDMDAAAGLVDDSGYAVDSDSGSCPGSSSLDGTSACACVDADSGRHPDDGCCVDVPRADLPSIPSPAIDSRDGGNGDTGAGTELDSDGGLVV